MCLMFLDKPCKGFVTALLSLEYPGKFIIHSSSLYFLYAREGEKLRNSMRVGTTFPASHRTEELVPFSLVQPRKFCWIKWRHEKSDLYATIV
jgi:hypothetical protein